MPNTLTNLLPDLYAGLDEVSRELVGFIPAVARSNATTRAAVGSPITFPISPSANVTNITPSMSIPEPTDQTIGHGTMSITKSRAAEFGFVGEEQRGLNTGPGYLSVQADMFAQALRTLTNEVEADLAVEAHVSASRAVGTAGTTPFATNSDGVSQARKTLVDNGSPVNNLQLVIDTGAGANVRTLYGINTDRDMSSVTPGQEGVLITPHGVAIRESAQVQSHTKGTAANTTTDAAGYAVGATTITVAGLSATGTILAGDVVTFAGDNNKYIVKSGDADTSDGGTITLQEPGLRVAIPASATAIAVGNSFVGNVAFYRNAIHLAARLPELPEEGDLALDRMTMLDPRSGLVFEVSIYGGYRKVRYEVALAWGVKTVQPRHTSILMG